MSNLVGALLDGRYRVERQVAEGGSSTVYAAEHLALGVPVAIKVLRPRKGDGDGDDDPARAERFLDEARILGRLRHPHIVASLGGGRVTSDPRSAPFLALTWCPGTTLAARLDETRGSGPRPLAEVWQIVSPILDAMSHVHAQGVVHGDLTPSNVIVDTASGVPVPRLVDFGVARDATTSPVTAAPTGLTKAYAAPEQVTGGAIGPATDVHALALLFLELLANRRPYGDAEPGVGVVDPVRPSAPRLGADAGPFGAVLERALRLDPAERHADARELSEAMRRAASIALEATTLPRAGDRVPPRAKRSRRRRIAWLAAGLAVAGALAVGVTWWLFPRAPEPGLRIARVRGELESAGYQVILSGRFGESDTLAAVSPRGATLDVSIVPAPDCRGEGAAKCGGRIRDAVVRDYRVAARSGMSVAYASDLERTLTTWSLDPDEALFARDVAVRGLGLATTGVVEPTDVPSGEGRNADRVSAWGPDELATRLRGAGLEVPWSGEGKGDLVAMASHLSGSETGSAHVYKGPLDEILKSLRAEPQGIAWARSRDRLLVLRGPPRAASKELLAKVVAGTDAVVEGAEP